MAAKADSARAGQVSGPGIIVVFDDMFEADARRTLEIAPVIAAEVSMALGLETPETVTVEFPEPAAFESAAGQGIGEWALAAAFPAESRISVRANRLDSNNDLATTLKHEYVHLLIGRLESRSGARVPVWFHEGVAQLLCARLFFGTRQDFLAAASSGRLLPLRALVSDWPKDERSARLAYAQSLDFVEYLEKNRPGAIRALLSETASKRDFDAAFSAVTGAGVEEAERTWRAAAPRGRKLLVAFFEDNPGLTWVALFAAAAVVLVIAGLRRAIRRRAIYDSLDD